MISGFLFLTILIIMLAILSISLLNRIQFKSDIHIKVSELQIDLLSLFRDDRDIIEKMSGMPKGGEIKITTLYKKRDDRCELISKKLTGLLDNTSSDQALQVDLNKIRRLVTAYNRKFQKLDSLAATRFRNAEKQLQLRRSLSGVFRSSTDEARNELLLLEIYEKEFLLSRDTLNVSRFFTQAEKLNQISFSNTSRDAFREYLDNFEETVAIELLIGLSENDGLRRELADLTRNIRQECDRLASKSSTMSIDARNEALGIYLVLVVIAIVFSILSSLWISRKLSEPIARLSKMVRHYRQQHAAVLIGADFDNAAREIKALVSAFTDLIQRSEVQMKEIQNKSKQLKRKNFELNRVNQELDNFLYSTAHDLRSPLTSLLGLLNLLKYETQLEAHYKYHEMMRSSIVRMENFISQIVNYSKNNRLAVSTEYINLRDLVNDIIEAHRYNEGSSKIRWIVDINDSVPAHSDRNRLTILLNNLISNAIRYADVEKPDPFVKIQIRTDFNNIYINFQDNGIGISKEHLSKIFDMFYRAHSTSKGSGLGLYILKQTIERMKGFVRVDSEVAVGTRFFINIRNNRAFVEHEEVPSALEEVE